MFHEQLRKHHDSRGGTNTPGPGESVSAIRFIANLIFQATKTEQTKRRKTEQNHIQILGKKPYGPKKTRGSGSP